MKDFLCTLVVLFAAFLLPLSLVQAAPIGTITGFKGEVIIQTGATFVPVTQIGQAVNTGDRIQTRDAEVELTFNDGAVLKLRPFSNASVDERDEESGFWVFKSKKPVRRLNVFIGKMRFKSGSSHRENILQTPTSVCALRGSEAEVGYNNIDSMLKMYAGQPFITGKFVRGFFADPGISAAAKNQVYRSLKQAFEVEQKAKTPVEKAKARVAALQVQKKAAKELMKNADPKVQEQAKLAAVVADAGIAAQKAKVVLEQVKQKQQESPDKQGDEVVKKAEQAAVEAESAAEKAAKAAEEGDLKGAEKAANDAEGAAAAAEEVKKEVVEESTDETTVEEETTEESTDETTVEEETTEESTTETTVEESTADTTTVEESTADTTTAEATTAETTSAEASTTDTTTVEKTTTSSVLTTTTSSSSSSSSSSTTTVDTTTVESTTTNETTAQTTTSEETTSIEPTSTSTSSSSTSIQETTASPTQ